MPRGSHRWGRSDALGVSGRLHRFATFAALLAILLQAFLIQTHVHAEAVGLSVERADRAAHGVPSAEVSGAHVGLEQACVVCQAAASSGRTLLPHRADSSLADGRVLYSSEIAEISIAVRPAHSWQSRGPPVSL